MHDRFWSSARREETVEVGAIVFTVCAHAENGMPVPITAPTAHLLIFHLFQGGTLSSNLNIMHNSDLYSHIMRCTMVTKQVANFVHRNQWSIVNYLYNRHNSNFSPSLTAKVNLITIAGKAQECVGNENEFSFRTSLGSLSLILSLRLSRIESE